EQTDQDCNNGDYHKQLDQRKAATPVSLETDHHITSRQGAHPLGVSGLFLPPCDVPYADLAPALVPRAGGHPPAVGAERRAPDLARVTPDQSRAVRAVRRQ